jgi:hypothetical protein
MPDEVGLQLIDEPATPAPGAREISEAEARQVRDPGADVIVPAGLGDEDTKRPVELAVKCGKSVREILAELVRDA